MGRVCSIHECWCPDGACRWCEAPEATPDVMNMSGVSSVMTRGDLEGVKSGAAMAIAAGMPVMVFQSLAPVPRKGYSATMTGITTDPACAHVWTPCVHTDAWECGKCRSLRSRELT